MDLIAEWIPWLTLFCDWIMHIDVYLGQLVANLGAWVYVILFAIVFCETGLVVTPFLPGDSLLFAAGALAALEGSPLNVYLLAAMLFIAAVAGDALNYRIGQYCGPRIFHSEKSLFFNKDHLLYTAQFFKKYGGKTIVIARFAPILRTFAPFVAGIGRMGYQQFGLYNILGGFLWVGSFTFAGYFLGNLPSVKRNFHIIVLVIVAISVLPAVVKLWQACSRPSPVKES